MLRRVPLPPPVSADFTSGALNDYWLARVAQHTEDSYMGVPMAKFPEDLRVYEHLLHESRAEVVVEIGCQFGGSALWFRDRLAALARYAGGSAPLVVSIDLDVAPARERIRAVDPAMDGLVLLDGDVRDPELPARVERLVPAGARCLVVEDSAHTSETTRAALDGFARFVPSGGFLVVEDGCVDVEELRLGPQWPRGVLPALRDWLATEAGSAFTVRRDLELYGMTCHPGGFLRRR